MANAPTRIIVAGYPKSGNTWLTRLIADVIGCPADGFLTHIGHVDNAHEGHDRKSGFVCCKSHHQWHELRSEGFVNENTRVVYILRDPRDVAVSSANFFRMTPPRFVEPLLRRIPKASMVYGVAGKKILPESFRIARTVRAVLHGFGQVHHWCRVSWRDHYKPFVDANCLIVRFEDLLSDAARESHRVLTFLGVQRTAEEIAAAVDRQSFKQRKQQFEEQGDRRRAKFLRSGRSEQWRTKLTIEQQQSFDNLIGDDLTRVGYALSTAQ